MSHFAKISGSDNVVTRVIVAEQDFISSGAVGDPANWIQTSYNTHKGVHRGPDGEPDEGVALRKNYAGIGFTYDEDKDAFIPPKPYDSWTLNEDTCLWICPQPRPARDEWNYEWSESSGSWEQTKMRTVTGSFDDGEPWTAI